MVGDYISREAAIKEMSHMMHECFPEAVEELDAVITTLEEIPAADVVERPRWIPVTERLPENCEDVLAYIERNAWVGGGDAPCRKREIANAYHVNGRWHLDGCSRVDCIAWMPLPEPPEEEV